jgi:predicted HNH restriction endonuclease
MLLSYDEFLNKLEEYNEKEKSLEILRANFVNDFKLESIKQLSLVEYCTGLKEKIPNGNKTFCYRLEFELDGLGRIKGATSYKFKIFYSKDNDSFQTTKFYSKKNGFELLKNNLYQIIKLGSEKYNINMFNSIRISPLIKMKILATYYPHKYFCISNEKHISHFLNKLNVKIYEDSNILQKQKKLIDFKNNNEIFKNWSNYIFMRYCYDVIGRPADEESYLLSKKRYSNDLVDEIRILPMSEIEFQNVQEVKKFITSNFSNSKYFYRTKSLNSKNNTLVLFQYDNRIVASSILIDKIKEKSVDNGIIYKGYYIFSKETIKYFEEEISSIDIKKIIPSFKKFSQVMQIIDLKYLSIINNLIDYKISNSKSIEEKLDYFLKDNLNNTIEKELYNKYSQTLIKKTKVEVTNGREFYPRERKVSINALMKANNKCEIDNSHISFKRKANPELDYTESHHLIPMAYQKDFEMSLDREQNIISLCSNCHNEIHYGLNAIKLITKLYDQRKEELAKIGLNISLKKLITCYCKE